MKKRSSNFLIVIPARAGSVGVPNKNLLKVHDVPLILRTFVHARFLSNNQIPICISTDSIPILEILFNYLDLRFNACEFKPDEITQVENFFIHFRSSEKASSETLISENLFDILNIFSSRYFTVDGIILLQPTSPFRSREELEVIREKILKLGNANTSIVSVTRVDDCHPARMYSLKRGNKLRSLKGFRKDYYSRRQDLPPIFIRDGGFYFIGGHLIRKSFQYSRSPSSTLRNFPWCINIDNLVDLEIAQKISKELVQNDPSSTFEEK